MRTKSQNSRLKSLAQINTLFSLTQIFQDENSVLCASRNVAKRQYRMSTC